MDSSELECPTRNRRGFFCMRPRWRHANQLLLLLGGIVLPILWEAGKKTEFTCGNCGAVIGARGFFAKLSFAFFWLLIILIGLSAWLVFG